MNCPDCEQSTWRSVLRKNFLYPAVDERPSILIFEELLKLKCGAKVEIVESVDQGSNLQVASRK